MFKLSKVASALSFAHLVGLGGRVSAESEDKKDKADPGERDHEDGNAKKAKKAEDKREESQVEDTGEDEQAAGDDLPASDDGDEDDKGDKKGKKAKGADEDKDDDEEKEDREVEMRGTSPAAQARRREQARCAAIFASPAAARNPALAANLAFKTRMTRKEAVAVLETSPAPAASGRTARAEHNPDVGPGGSGAPTSRQAVAASWDSAFKKVSGRRH